MKKTYILDTNVLLHDPMAILHFEDNTVVLPIAVIEEIDTFKRDLSELGRNARHAARLLDELRGGGKLSEGVPLENGGILRIEMVDGDLSHSRSPGAADCEILKLARHLSQQPKADPCVVVSKDINLRIKADGIGVSAQDYETDRVDINEVYLGYDEIELSPDMMNAFQKQGLIPYEGSPRNPNEYLLLKNTAEPQHTLLGRIDPEGRSILALLPVPREFGQIRPRNMEQYFAVDALLDERIKLVTMIGKAGTGKTLLAVAAGLYGALDRKLYRKVLVSRPTLPMGKDIGFLPGTVDEKMAPWMQPIFDALDLLTSGREGSKSSRETLKEEKIVEVEALSFIRGRSLHHQFIIVDEAQNLTPLEVKTIITRVGHGSKIILTGDIYQIDNPYVDSTSNGLSKAVGKFCGFGLAAHVTLTRGVRSELAELAADIL